MFFHCVVKKIEEESNDIVGSVNAEYMMNVRAKKKKKKKF